MKARTYQKIMSSVFSAVNASKSITQRQKQVLLKRVSVTMMPIHPAMARAKKKRISERLKRASE
mgnify:CR=1 FL=1